MKILPVGKGESRFDELHTCDVGLISEIDAVVQNSITEDAEFDDSFWNLSEVNFLNNDVEGIQLTVDLDFIPPNEVKDFEKGKWKKKSIDQILGIPKSKKKGKKKKQSRVLFRSTVVVAVALPISSQGIKRTHLNEAQAIWTVNKIMGLHYMGDEQDLIRRLAIMEGEYEERAKGQ